MGQSGGPDGRTRVGESASGARVVQTRPGMEGQGGGGGREVEMRQGYHLNNRKDEITIKKEPSYLLVTKSNY